MLLGHDARLSGTEVAVWGYYQVKDFKNRLMNWPKVIGDDNDASDVD